MNLQTPIRVQIAPPEVRNMNVLCLRNVDYRKDGGERGVAYLTVIAEGYLETPTDDATNPVISNLTVFPATLIRSDELTDVFVAAERYMRNENLSMCHSLAKALLMVVILRHGLNIPEHVL